MWEGWWTRNQGALPTLKSKMMARPVLPFQKIQAIDIREEEEGPAKKKEARVRAVMLAMNTVALQTQKLVEEAAEENQMQT